MVLLEVDLTNAVEIRLRQGKTPSFLRSLVIVIPIDARICGNIYSRRHATRKVDNLVSLQRNTICKISCQFCCLSHWLNQKWVNYHNKYGKEQNMCYNITAKQGSGKSLSIRVKARSFPLATFEHGNWQYYGCFLQMMTGHRARGPEFPGPLL